MDKQSIQDNIQMIKSQIDEAARIAGRNSGDIDLVAVSKTKPLEMLLEAYDAGQTLFGENRVEDAVSKRSELPSDADIDFIGHLQSNKAKSVIGLFRLIHSIDSVKIGEKIDRLSSEAGVVQRVLLQVNPLNEESKSGFSDKDSLFLALDQLLKAKALRIEGFMTIAPFTSNKDIVRNCFAQSRDLAEVARSCYGDMIGSEISMGMSGDFTIAIEEGSTMVRVGSSIFGVR